MTFPTLKPRGESIRRLRDASIRLRELKTLLHCTGPLVAFDLEGTGPFRDYDRICEIGAVKVRPDGTYAMLSTLVNPLMPIGSGATEKHGITDADVQDAPKFVEIAPLFAPGLQHCALVGYNLRGYDIPVLTREFSLAGFQVELDFLPVIDAFVIYQLKEPRDLNAAVRRFCSREREAAHDAGVDVLDTVDVLLGQMSEFADLPRDVAALAEFCDRKKPEFIDRAGKFQWRNGEAIVAFTKHQGTLMRYLDEGFYRWILGGDFESDTKRVALRALDGQFPEPPARPVPHDENSKKENVTGRALEETTQGVAAATQSGLFPTQL